MDGVVRIGKPRVIAKAPNTSACLITDQEYRDLKPYHKCRPSRTPKLTVI